MAGMARFAISRPDLPKMSPMNRIRTSVGPHWNAMLPAAPLLDPWQPHAQLAGPQRGLDARDIERAGQTNRPREPSKYPFCNMEGGLVGMCACGRPLHAGDDQCVASNHDLHRVRFPADEIQHHVDAI